jgi:hypothetical protein
MEVVADVGPWNVAVDPEATKHAYEALGTVSAADGCDCAYCLNFRAARPNLYPAEFLELLGRLGVDPRCEHEAQDFGPCEATWYEEYERQRGAWQEWTWIYMGCFRALGRVVSGPPWPERLTTEDGYEMKASRGFSYGLGSSTSYEQAPGGPADSPPFRSHQTFVIAFKAEVPWLLETPPWTTPRSSRLDAG